MAIRHKRKNQSNYVWSSSDLVEGQIGLNIADGTAHFKKADNTVVTLGSGGSDYADSDARAALSGSFGINYNNSTGDIKLVNTGLPTPYTGTVVSIDGDADTITLNSVMGLTMGNQIVFTGAELSGTNINSGFTYYITSIDMPNSKIQINSLMMGALDINSLSPSGTITWEASTSGGGGSDTYKLTYSVSNNSFGWQPETTASVSLSSLTDTQITMPANGDVLTFDSSSFKWKNLPASGGGIDLTDISVTDSGGDGSLSYDNTTGVFTYTGPSASEVRAHFSAGTGISITDGVITNTVTDTGITDLVQDTTPQLGGNLDVNGNSIVSASNGNIILAPDGTGIVRSDKSVQIQAAGELRLADNDSSHYVGFKSPATVSTNRVWTLPAADGTDGQVLSTNGSGALSWATAGGGGTPYIVFRVTSDLFVSSGLYRGVLQEVVDTGSITTLTSSNARFTLPAGSYIAHAFPMVLNAGGSSNAGAQTLFNVTTDNNIGTLFAWALTGQTSGPTNYFGVSGPVLAFTLSASSSLEYRIAVDSNGFQRRVNNFYLYKIA